MPQICYKIQIEERVYNPQREKVIFKKWKMYRKR